MKLTKDLFFLHGSLFVDSRNICCFGRTFSYPFVYFRKLFCRSKLIRSEFLRLYLLSLIHNKSRDRSRFRKPVLFLRSLKGVVWKCLRRLEMQQISNLLDLSRKVLQEIFCIRPRLPLKSPLGNRKKTKFHARSSLSFFRFEPGDPRIQGIPFLYMQDKCQI